jgi:hypothetical protein
VLGLLQVFRGDAAAARSAAEQGLVLSQRLGSPRFEADSLNVLGEAQGLDGDRAEALRLQRAAFEAAGETGIPHAGALVLGAIARLTDDPRERLDSIARGEALLEGDSASHNHLHFHQSAMEAWLAAKEWDDVERHAAALDAYTRGEPLPWSRFWIERGRALAAFGRGDRDAPLLATLAALATEARAVQLNIALPVLDAALKS